LLGGPLSGVGPSLPVVTPGRGERERREPARRPRGRRPPASAPAPDAEPPARTPEDEGDGRGETHRVDIVV
jgi:hypothetical protein